MFHGPCYELPDLAHELSIIQYTETNTWLLLLYYLLNNLQTLVIEHFELPQTCRDMLPFSDPHAWAIALVSYQIMITDLYLPNHLEMPITAVDFEGVAIFPL